MLLPLSTRGTLNLLYLLVGNEAPPAGRSYDGHSWEGVASNTHCFSCSRDAYELAGPANESNLRLNVKDPSFVVLGSAVAFSELPLEPQALFRIEFFEVCCTPGGPFPRAHAPYRIRATPWTCVCRTRGIEASYLPTVERRFGIGSELHRSVAASVPELEISNQDSNDPAIVSRGIARPNVCFKRHPYTSDRIRHRSWRDCSHLQPQSN